MRMRIVLCVVLLGALLPKLAFASQGILLLADEGNAEWNNQLTQLAASVDKQTPAEVAFWAATTSNVQAAVDRLIQRGVSEIVAVPLFIAAPSADLNSQVTSSVPLRVTAGLNGDPVVAEIVMSRAQEMSADTRTVDLMLVSHRPTPGGDQRWVPDLSSAAQQVNRTRRFATILTVFVPPGGSEPRDVASLRRLVERDIALGRRILVVPVLTTYGGPEAAIKEQLQGLAHELTPSALMPDDRLVAWVVSHADVPALAGK